MLLKNTSPYLLVETEALVYTVESLVAEFGGALGLFVGFSFIGTFEWLYGNIKSMAAKYRLRSSESLLDTPTKPANIGKPIILPLGNSLSKHIYSRYFSLFLTDTGKEETAEEGHTVQVPSPTRTNITPSQSGSDRSRQMMTLIDE